ncbi:MAG: hypothetical protein ACWGMT_02750 [Burkholderiales bacterium]
MFVKVRVSFFYNAVRFVLQLSWACLELARFANKSRATCYGVAGRLRNTA